MQEISVVVPAYNAQASLTELAHRVEAALRPFAKRFELILVDDGSHDETWAVIGKLAHTYPWIRGISLLRNYGQHNALLAGIRAARYAICVTCDDDLQHRPESVPELVRLLDRGYDVIYGSPKDEKHGWLRTLASKTTKLALAEALGAKNARGVSALRAFRTHLRDAFGDYHSPHVCIDVLLTWGTDRFCAVEVPHDLRRFGKSNYTLKKLFRHTANMMTGFTIMPLQVASLLGFASVIFGMGVLGYTVIRRIILGAVMPGFAFLASEIAIFSGIQLFVLGIFGEYFARMHQRTMEKPVYVIRETTVSDQALHAV